MKLRMTQIMILMCVVAALWALAPRNVAANEIRIAIIDSGAKAYVDEAVSFTTFSADSDPLNHGTHVAKLIREANPDATIYMLQVCEQTSGTLKPSRQAILMAIDWSIEHNIDIVNMSLVTKYDEKIEKAIIDASTSHGIIFIAAAGNKTLASHFSADSDGFIHRVSKPVEPGFPASSEHVISVGSKDEFGQIASYSDATCDLYADGKILGQEGTSFSSARITARAAKILSQIPHATSEIVLSYLSMRP
ncbi:MAG: S8 family serine peptidase [Candidatus Omnitrophota bacterium]